MCKNISVYSFFLLLITNNKYYNKSTNNIEKDIPLDLIPSIDTSYLKNVYGNFFIIPLIKQNERSRVE